MRTIPIHRVLPLGFLAFAGCTVTHGIDELGDRCPPSEFGRPAWVRVSAGVGAWIGGVVGGVVSIALLPVTYPISLLADDGLGDRATSDFLFFPALGGAAIGHAFLGGATDVVDYTFHRAWVGWDGDPVTHYGFVPQEGPSLPPSVAPAGEGGAKR
ncbi:MAG: hypothetical protein U1E73_06595 [Planctomycetota bacterium]